MIAVSNLEKAKKLQAQAAAKPEDFGNLAKDYSEDAPSASAKGVINPIRKHGSYKEIEDAVFNMADGEVSPVIHAGGQYVILKREGAVARPAREASSRSPRKLEEILRDRKMRSVAQDIFQQLQKNAKVENVWNDPAKRAADAGRGRHDQRRRRSPSASWTRSASPGTARRPSKGMINRKILEQACQKRNIAVTDGRHRRGNRPRGVGRRQAQAGRLARRGSLAGIGDQEAGHSAWTCIATTWSGPRWR